jgi:hypothetical protein
LAESLTVLQNVCNGVPQPSRSEEIIRDVAIIAAATFPVILLRFISRSLVANKVGWDDWAVGFGAVSRGNGNINKTGPYGSNRS